MAVAEGPMWSSALVGQVRANVSSQIAPHFPLPFYSLCFQMKVTFGHKLRYEIKVTFGEISLKLCQTNWNVVKNNVNVVANELPSQITIYTCLVIDIWTQWHQRTSMWFYVLRCHPPKMADFQ
jgi:hypothetical protein